MDWVRGGVRFIQTPDNRFYICKSAGGVYTLSDNNELICSHRGEGALQECKRKAEKLAAAPIPRKQSRFAQAA